MATKTIIGTIQARRDTSANWETHKTVIPAAGEPCLDLDTGAVKWGNGVDTYEDLPVSGGAAASHYEGIKQEGESDTDVIARVLGTLSAQAGVDDIFIVKTLIADDKYAYAAYVYDGENWAAMDGNYSAENVYFPSDLTITAPIGVQTIPASGSKTLETAGKTVKQVFDLLMAEEKNPAITNPTASITSAQIKAYEVGTSVTPHYQVNLNPGSYQFGPDTGVTATSYQVSDSDDNQLTTQSGDFPALVVGDGENYTMSAQVGYSDGAVPVTNLGNEYPAGKITAGTLSASTGAITGYRNSFYGTFTAKDTEGTTSASIRTLTKSGGALKAGSKFSITIPVGALRVVFAYPATLRDVSSVLDVNGLGAEIKSGFTQSTVSVEGADGYTAIEYKVYTLDFANANDTANTYNVTI